MVIRGFNLATADYRRVRRQSLLTSVAAGCLALILLAQVAYWAVLRHQTGGIGTRVAAMETQVRGQEEKSRGSRAGAPADLKAYEAKVAAYNKIIEASTFSWTGLLFELERVVPPTIELQDIQPDLATGKVTLSGMSRSFEDVTKFVHALSQRPAFKDVNLLREAERKQDARPGRPPAKEVAFGVTLLYEGRPR
jgi:Tfp pilus assembly protein PilN